MNDEDTDFFDLCRHLSDKWGDTGLIAWRVSPGREKLDNLFPNGDAASRDYSELRQFVINGVSRAVGKDDGLDVVLTDGEKKLLRFGRSWKPGKEFKVFGPSWGKGISLAFAVMPRLVRRYVRQVFDDLHIFEIRSVSLLTETFETLTSIFKKHGELYTSYWKWFVNWETLGGYKAELDYKAALDKVVAWVGTVKLHTYPDATGEWTSYAFNAVFREGCDHFLNMGPSVNRANERVIDIDTFASSPAYWAGSGSSSVKCKVQYTDLASGKTFNAKKSKFRAAFTRSREEISAVLRENRDFYLTPHSKVVWKRERAKVRAVITSDDNTYLRGAFIYRWLDDAMHNHPSSTLFSSTPVLVQILEQMRTRLEVNQVQFPADQEKFDYHVNIDMLDAMMAAQGAYIQLNAREDVKNDLLTVNNSLRTSLVRIRGLVDVPQEGGTTTAIAIINGLLSGLRGTAFLGTMSNYATAYVVRKLLLKIGFEDQVTKVYAQGDDDDFVVKSYGYAAAMVKVYGLTGFSLNPKKFFIDTKRNEFLRQVGDANGVAGYPIRALGSILWRNPVNRDPPSGILRVRETVDSWSILRGRGGDDEACIRLMMLDVSHGNGISLSQTKGILSTPAVEGGLGMFETSGPDRIRFSAGNVKKDIKLATWPLVGLKSELELAAASGITLRDSDVSRAVLDRLDTSQATVTIIKGEAKEYSSQEVSLSWMTPGTDKAPLVCRSVLTLPPMLKTAILDRAISDKNWEWIRLNYVSEDHRQLSRTIENRGGRRVWVDWLKGDLGFSLPRLWGASNIQLSTMYLDICEGVWARVIRLHSFSHLTIVRAAMAAERMLRASLARKAVRIGG